MSLFQEGEGRRGGVVSLFQEGEGRRGGGSESVSGGGEWRE